MIPNNIFINDICYGRLVKYYLDDVEFLSDIANKNSFKEFRIDQDFVVEDFYRKKNIKFDNVTLYVLSKEDLEHVAAGVSEVNKLSVRVFEYGKPAIVFSNGRKLCTDVVAGV